MFKYFTIISIFLFISCSDSKVDNPTTPSAIQYTFPEEKNEHEGTWLQWPHHYQYGETYRDRLDATWVALAKEIVDVEKLHLIVYDQVEKNRVVNLLEKNNIPLTNIDFRIYPNDDVWVRDNGPIFAKDSSGKLVIEDWGFNGWGNKAKFSNCNQIPQKIAIDNGIPVVDLNSVLINEGGSIEIDGSGTMMATKSSILNNNRNPNKDQNTVEQTFTKYLGVTNFIWLDGVAGIEITDMHIDGFARFFDDKIILTMDDQDLTEWQVPSTDIAKLKSAKNAKGEQYSIKTVPLTKENVTTAYGKKLGFKGSYINYYILNNKVLVPNYKDPNDSVANSIIQSLYPGRKVVGIDVRNLYENGGMIHCVTQQQPL